MTDDRIHVQAARLLEGIETLGQQYGDVLATGAPELGRALSDAAVAIRRFIEEPVAAEPAEPATSDAR